LINRIVEEGAALAAAKELARQIAAFPQLCLRTDRNSAYAQWDLSLADALRNEGKNGVSVVLAEGLAGAGQFAQGMGRHGNFDESN
jgi:enoyl-CoA hydratase